MALYPYRKPEPSEIFSAFFKQQFQRQTILNQVSQLPRTLSQLKGAQLPGREAEEVDGREVEDPDESRQVAFEAELGEGDPQSRHFLRPPRSA